MIYLFYGSDVGKVRDKAFAWIAGARTKEPNVAYVRLAHEEITPAALEEATLSGGLFVKRLLILLDDPFQKGRSTEDGEGTTEDTLLEEHIDALAASNNVFVILAPELGAAKAKKIAAKAVKTYTLDAPPHQEETRGFNANLVNALQTRSREKLWLELERALRKGDAPELLHGLLHWKARNLIEKESRAWTPEESRALSLSLIEVLQESRRKGIDLSESLERFALSI